MEEENAENKDCNNGQKQYKQESVEKVIEETVTSGLHAMVLALGYKVGIIDAFERLNKPSTAVEISEEAGLNLRYVQEWLSCMTAKGIIQLENKKFCLPCSERVQKAVLTSAVLPMFCDCLPKLESVMRVKDKNTGYPFPQKDLEWIGKFNEINSFDQQWIENNLGTVIENHYKDTQEVISEILDFGCGYGKLCQQLAQVYQEVNITGTDIDEESVQHCRKVYSYPNLFFTSSRDGSLKQKTFDIVILHDVLHDLPDPEKVLYELRTILRPNGYIVTFDPDISSDVSKNVGNEAAQSHLPYSVFFCLPNSMSESPAIGHGAGWGVEDRKKFIREKGFTIVNVDETNVESNYSRIVFK
ncbi:S-adenosylmethionine-dependent methyltransferase Rv2258c-like [Saccostrea echinata]|uniref:S-adenosylmethionine-dependent methyltransferase Rv2258c-like n=1 Tax=Saccostrea echinata TaxID=191078 RepID=UPI002A8268DE|nr:S-adenosylmethionine-dependent methyltransferase Rv2258c-like [Saccostrea echinata]XP_061169439.1 S-adenosylmethionine-dependent methyltransferase Rv2258c-like [Saccostrea echinata]